MELGTERESFGDDEELRSQESLGTMDAQAARP
jgi:hypothetical protein